MSNSLWDPRRFESIFQGAYFSTAWRLEKMEGRITGALASHGINLDLTKARDLKERVVGVVPKSFFEHLEDRDRLRPMR
ncbi:MAG: hypothetical protein HQK57_07935 [Deltaproteobacteria bacterium]|nr:hypothetical protein [Deltaproteobacteria bacterium]MBF0524343.1 hypothetical protein [Deltaproteobacteria bacterium]